MTKRLVHEIQIPFVRDTRHLKRRTLRYNFTPLQHLPANGLFSFVENVLIAVEVLIMVRDGSRGWW